MKRAFLALAIVAILATSIFGLIACNNDEGPASTTLRFVVPDGTPALAAMSFLGTTTVDGYSVEGSIVAATSIQTEIGGEKADMVIAPTNAGAVLINKGADYKLAAVMVEGSLYLVGEKVHEDDWLIDFADLKGKKIASIGQNNTPDKVFKYIVDNTAGMTYNDDTDTITFADNSVTTIEFVADASAALVALSRDNSPCDFAIVGQPAQTVFYNKGYKGSMNLQDKYMAINGDENNFPQAALFVKTSLYTNADFMSALIAKLEESNEWVYDNAEEVTNTMKVKGSTATFPAESVQRCAITVKTADDKAVQTSILQYLNLMVPAVKWANVALF